MVSVSVDDPEVWIELHHSVAHCSQDQIHQWSLVHVMTQVHHAELSVVCAVLQAALMEGEDQVLYQQLYHHQLSDHVNYS